jgi:hypothetical protein
VQNLAFFVLPDFKITEYSRSPTQPTARNCSGTFGSLIEPLGLRKTVQAPLQTPYARPAIRAETPTLSNIETEAHLI